MKNNKYLVIVAAFLILLTAIITYAISRIEDKEPIKEFFINEKKGEMQNYEVNTEPYEPNIPKNIETSDSYDEKYLDYLDKRQEARDKTASGR